MSVLLDILGNFTVLTLLLALTACSSVTDETTKGEQQKNAQDFSKQEVPDILKKVKADNRVALVGDYILTKPEKYRLTYAQGRTLIIAPADVTIHEHPGLAARVVYDWQQSEQTQLHRDIEYYLQATGAKKDKIFLDGIAFDRVSINGGKGFALIGHVDKDTGSTILLDAYTNDISTCSNYEKIAMSLRKFKRWQ